MASIPFNRLCDVLDGRLGEIQEVLADLEVKGETVTPAAVQQALPGPALNAELIAEILAELWLLEMDQVDYFGGDPEALRQLLDRCPCKELPEYHYFSGFLAGIQLAPLIEQGFAEIQVARASVAKSQSFG